MVMKIKEHNDNNNSNKSNSTCNAIDRIII